VEELSSSLQLEPAEDITAAYEGQSSRCAEKKSQVENQCKAIKFTFFPTWGLHLFISFPF
jgi:hypothetical protein